MILAGIDWNEIWNVITKWCMSFGKNILISILVLFIGSKIIKFVVRRISKSFGKSKLDGIVSKFLVSLIKFLLYFVLLIIVITILGIPTSSFIAALSAAGLAIGLALQGSLSNFAGGVLILLFKPFTIGDFIREDTHGNEGIVVGIDLFYTRIIDAEDRKVVIPNGVLANSSLTNYTTMGKRNLYIRIGISYDSDIKKAKAILMDVLQRHEEIIEPEKMAVDVVDLEESQVTIRTRCWVKAEDFLSLKFALLEEYKEEFDRNGIVIPFNQLSITINGQKDN